MERLLMIANIMEGGKTISGIVCYNLESLDNPEFLSERGVQKKG